MSNAPLMPKATAVWLVENTSLTFEQIASFCKLHPLEVKGIADGEVAAGIKGHDPITSGQLTREEIAAAEAEEKRQLQLAVSKVRLPEPRRKRGARYTPLSRRQDRPNAILWLIRNHPELKDAQIMRLAGTTKTTLQAIRVAVLHEGPKISNAMLQAIQQAATKSNDPQVTAALDYFKSPQGLAVMLLFALVSAFFASIILGSIGGALGGVFLSRRDRS